MKKINAEIVADSVNIQGNRLTTYVLTYPRMIHAEVMTHRMFSRNAASSRAIPFEKMLKMVEEDPFIPIAWQKDHKGMQGVEYFTEPTTIERLNEVWLHAKDRALDAASVLSSNDVTKQLCNRLLEPFMWYTALVTTTEYDNFFDLRCPKYTLSSNLSDRSGEPFWTNTYKSKKDLIAEANMTSLNGTPIEDLSIFDWLRLSTSGAEIHIQALAEAMWDARNESEPRVLKAGEWHIPFGDQMNAENFVNANLHTLYSNGKGIKANAEELKVQVAVARCARLSYMTFEGTIDYKKDIELFQMLFKNRHMSPFEHVARSMDRDEYTSFIKGRGMAGYIGEPLSFKREDFGWCNNFKGFIPYRYLIENKE